MQLIMKEDKLVIRHDTEYEPRNVPRYDVNEMAIHFPTVHSFLSLFRHLTSMSLTRIIMKEKTRRKRRKVSEDSWAEGHSGVQTLQLLGDYVSQQDEMVFTIGSVFQPGITPSETFQYPVLHRVSKTWNNLDRVFKHPLALEWMTPERLLEVYNREKEHVQEIPTRSRVDRKRVTETFLGFKWIKSSEQHERTSAFHSSDANEIHGDLHFCAPRVIFVGALLVPDILRLCESTPSVFDLS